MTSPIARTVALAAARTVALAALVLLPACGPADDGADEASSAASAAAVAETPQDAYWQNLQALCESTTAAAGELLQAPDDQIDPESALVVHFRECGDEELRFPLHVDDNRSRTWVFIRHDDHLELRHDHRHEDGIEESNTWYGATTMEEGSANSQEFGTERADGSRGGWRVMIEPGQRYTYGTIRDGEWRHHLEFDLTTPVDAPPPPWGHETRPSQRP